MYKMAFISAKQKSVDYPTFTSIDDDHWMALTQASRKKLVGTAVPLKPGGN